MSRQDSHKKFHRALNTPECVELVKELKKLWYDVKLVDQNAILSGYNMGLSDAYKYIKQLQDGDFIDGNIRDGDAG